MFIHSRRRKLYSKLKELKVLVGIYKKTIYLEIYQYSNICDRTRIIHEIVNYSEKKASNRQ